MTESEWLNSTDPEKMLTFLFTIPAHRRGRPTSRKLRLFACGVVRTAWQQLTEPCCRTAVEVAERFVDGLADKRELISAREAALRVWQATCRPAQLLFKAAHKAAGWDAAQAAEDAARELRRFDEAAGSTQGVYLRDIFGPLPFREVTLDPAWLAWNDGVVAKLAASIYEGRAFEQMPILADALEEAGCTDADILGHCRGPGPHARGCWLIDALLDKS
jgi:hypothetical protein